MQKRLATPSRARARVRARGLRSDGYWEEVEVGKRWRLAKRSTSCPGRRDVALFASATSISYTEKPVVEDEIAVPDLEVTFSILSNSVVLVVLFFPIFIL